MPIPPAAPLPDRAASPDEPPAGARRIPSSGLRALAIAVGVVVLAAGLRAAQPILVPLLVGLFLAVLAHPLYAGLRARLPGPLRWLAIVATMLVVVAGLAAFLALLGWTMQALADEVLARRAQIEAQLAALRATAVRMGLASAGGADPASDGGVGSFARGLARSVATTAAAAVAGLGLAIGFAALGLVETDEARRRIAALHRGGRRALDTIDEAAPAFRRYVWVKSLTSAVTGVATALASLALGLPLWWVWGVIAFLFEYVPTVGSVLAVFPPVLIALAEGGPERALVVLLVIGAVQVTLGNVVDPRIEGRLMAVSPFGVLLSIVVWGWLWGAVGALLAVPLTVALVVASRHIPHTRGFATIVAGDGVDEHDDRHQDRHEDPHDDARDARA